ncbi:MAG: hypothetical protein IPH20_26645 [Bacteroidales bacterium]|nr:hypothetical protein [Bacteroidales bacterium]
MKDKGQERGKGGKGEWYKGKAKVEGSSPSRRKCPERARKKQRARHGEGREWKGE